MVSTKWLEKKITNNFKSMENSKKQTLSTGKVVEDTLYNLGLAENNKIFVTVLLSILIWSAQGTDCERAEISDMKLPQIQQEVDEFLNKFKGLTTLKTINDMVEKVCSVKKTDTHVM